MLKLLQAIEPGTVRAQKRPQSRSLKLWRGGFCFVVRADAESADGTGRQVRRRRFSGGPGGRSPPGKSCATQRDIDQTESIDGTEHNGDRTDRT
eukprot:3054019-Alexandrium_andersonii.AAC.3